MNTVRSLDFQGEKRRAKSPYDVNSHHFVSINEFKLMRRVGEITFISNPIGSGLTVLRESGGPQEGRTDP